jgi:hypothetical protein
MGGAPGGGRLIPCRPAAPAPAAPAGRTAGAPHPPSATG